MIPKQHPTLEAFVTALNALEVELVITFQLLAFEGQTERIVYARTRYSESGFPLAEGGWVWDASVLHAWYPELATGAAELCPMPPQPITLPDKWSWAMHEYRMERCE